MDIKRNMPLIIVIVIFVSMVSTYTMLERRDAKATIMEDSISEINHSGKNVDNQ